jgi:hypothetical protein
MKTILAIPALLTGLILAAPAEAGSTSVTIGFGTHPHHVSHPRSHRWTHGGYRHGYGRPDRHYHGGIVYRYVAPPVIYYHQPVRPAYVVVPPPVVTYYQAAPAYVTYPAPQAYCREYMAPIVVSGSQVMGYGQACMQPDGSWRQGPLQPVR